MLVFAIKKNCHTYPYKKNVLYMFRNVNDDSKIKTFVNIKTV